MGDITSSGCNTGSYPSPNGPDKSQDLLLRNCSLFLHECGLELWTGYWLWWTQWPSVPQASSIGGKLANEVSGFASVPERPVLLWQCQAVCQADTVLLKQPQGAAAGVIQVQVRAPQLGTSVWSEFHQEQYDQMLSGTRKAAGTGCRMPKAWPQSTSVSLGMVPLITMLCIHCFIVPWFHWQENTANWTSSRLYKWVHLC